MLRWLLSIVFMAHGLAHLVGFVVPWGLWEVKDAPYRTTLLAGRVDVGDTGIRVFGLLWLGVALAFIIAGIAGFVGQLWWPFAIGVALFSLVLGTLGWPDTRIGVVVDVVILILLTLGVRAGWLPMSQG
jgi:hypothetical protein